MVYKSSTYPYSTATAELALQLEIVYSCTRSICRPSQVHCGHPTYMQCTPVLHPTLVDARVDNWVLYQPLGLQYITSFYTV